MSEETSSLVILVERLLVVGMGGVKMIDWLLSEHSSRRLV